MFIVELTYLKPLIEVEKFVVAHRSYLDTYYKNGLFIVSGPKVPRDGGIIITHDISKEELIPILENDPFFLNGVVSFKLTEFQGIKKTDRLI